MPLSLRLLAALLVVPIRASAARAAVRDTTLALPGLAAPVEVTTDLHGIPHVRARSLSDLYLAWGFVTARDRLWQLEHGRRAASGRLWEWFGNRALRGDGGAQLFELHERAVAIWRRDSLDAGVRVALERYTAGINAWMGLCRRGAQRWPPEFLRLGHRPENWRPADCILFLLAQGVLLDLELPELAEAETLRTHDPSWFERRRRYESDWSATTIPDSVADALYGRPAHPRLPGRPSGGGVRVGHNLAPVGVGHDPELGASDAFVVGPARSESGAPLLANDIHLSLTAPGPFHVIHVTVPDTVDAAGACVPGLPIVVSGRNRRAAWGVTSLGADVMDVYADTLSTNGRAVRWQGRWVPLREADYTMRFHLLGMPLPPIGQKRRYTPHGPVVVYDRKRHLALAVRWPALEQPVTLKGLIGLERSKDVDELCRRARTLVTPALNMMAADVEGHARYQTTGALPRRGFDPGYGVLPGDGRHEWLGIIPPDSMPAWDVPRAGFAVNGNNLPIGSPYPEALPRYDWTQDRAARMGQRLAGDARVTLSDARSVQNDVYSRAAERFLPRLLACADSVAPSLPDTARAALDTLRAWDRLCLRNRVAPTIFRAWLTTFLDRFDLSDVPGLAAAALDGRAPEALRDTRGVPVRAATAAAMTLEEALSALKLRLGPNLGHWWWGVAHRAQFRHALAWSDPTLDPPAVPVDGDASSPCVAPSGLPRRLSVTFGPTWRHLVDLSVPDSSLAVIPPGNAGDGAHRTDQLQRWADHRYVPLYLDWDRIAASAETEWRLVPGR
jgi:penicillin amidase